MHTDALLMLSKVLLANGSEVRVGSAVLLQAPPGEEVCSIFLVFILFF